MPSHNCIATVFGVWPRFNQIMSHTHVNRFQIHMQIFSLLFRRDVIIVMTWEQADLDQKLS